MERHVWVAEGDDEPAWAVGGSYHVVRVIRMFVEFWDRTRLGSRRRSSGDMKANGAPLDGDVETDLPDYEADPGGDVTPLDADIRLANPRTAGTQDDLLLRNGLSFSRGFDGDGQLDQGLAFVSFQRRLRQFRTCRNGSRASLSRSSILPEGGALLSSPCQASSTPMTDLGRGLVAWTEPTAAGGRSQRGVFTATAFE